jgi:hypothetical protein
MKMEQTNTHDLQRGADVYHYTAWAKLPAIVASGELRPSSAGAPGEKPLLWFSANPRWEPTATKLRVLAGRVFRMSFAEMEERFGAVRFVLPRNDPRLMKWASACRYAGTPTAPRLALERAGRLQGANPAHWLAIKSSLAVEALGFHVCVEGRWCAADPNEMATVWAEIREAHG